MTSSRRLTLARVLRWMLNCVVSIAHISGNLFLSSSPAVNYRERTSRIHARAVEGDIYI